MNSRGFLFGLLRGRYHISYLLVGFALGHTSMSAQTFVVTTTADPGPGSLREGIVLLNGSQSGTLDLTQLRGVISLTSALPAIKFSGEILGPGTSQLTLDGNFRVPFFLIPSGVTQRITGLTLSQGYAGRDRDGGAIRNFGSLSLESCALLTNRVYGGFGGAIFSAGQLTLKQSLFAENRAVGAPGQQRSLPTSFTSGGASAGMGGAVFVESGELLATDCGFLRNFTQGGGSGTYGGGIDPNPPADSPGRGGGGTGSLTESGPVGFGGGGGVFTNGGFGGGGGGNAYSSLYGGGDGAAPCPREASEGGPGGAFGGALFLKDGAFRVIACQFIFNTAVGGIGRRTAAGAFGGAVFVFSGDLYLGTSLCASNSAGSDSLSVQCDSSRNFRSVPATHGGGLNIHGGAALIEKSLFVGNTNSAPGSGVGYGGGICVDGGVVELRNTTVSGNAGTGKIGFSYDSMNGWTSYFGGVPKGAGVCVTNGVLSMVHCTVVSNLSIAGNHYPLDLHCDAVCRNQRTGAGAGGLSQVGGRLQLRASIVAGNQSKDGGIAPNGVGSGALRPFDLDGPVQSLGYNLVQSNNALGVLTSTDLTDSNPRLGPLTVSNAGMGVHPLLPGSPAINAVPLDNLLTEDAIGTRRPQGPYGDMGAVEAVGLDAPALMVKQPSSPIALESGLSSKLVAGLWSGPGEVRYQWFQDGRAVAGATNRDVLISVAGPEWEGQWTLYATNATMSITSAPVVVRLRRPSGSAAIDWVRLSVPTDSYQDSLSFPVHVAAAPGRIRFAQSPGLQFVGVSSNPVPVGVSSVIRTFSITGEPIGFLPLTLPPGSTFGVGFVKSFATNTDVFFRGVAAYAAQRYRSVTLLDDELTSPIVTRTFAPLDPQINFGSLVGDGDPGYWLLPQTPIISGNAPIRKGDPENNITLSIDWSGLSSFAFAGSNGLFLAGQTSSLPVTVAIDLPPAWGEIVRFTSAGQVAWRKLVVGPGSRSPILCAASRTNLFLYIENSYSNRPESGIPPLILSDLTIKPSAESRGLVPNFLVSMTADGRVLWVREIRSLNYGQPPAIAADSLGNCYVFVGGPSLVFTGSKLGNVSLDACTCSHSGLAKYSAGGEVAWVSRIRLAAFLTQPQIIPDELGGCYFKGAFYDNAFPRSDVDFGGEQTKPGYRFAFGHISAPVRLAVVPSLPDAPPGDADATIVGEPSMTYDLEWSSDLVNWTFTKSVQASEGISRLKLVGSATEHHRFYRAKPRAALLP